MNRVPLKRIAQPDEIVPFAVFLASDASSYMTGTVIDLDGGTTALSPGAIIVTPLS
jgi:NAD(P)-dependent dehydrogenase (short-subunit alcohol dehydrogenase family)